MGPPHKFLAKGRKEAKTKKVFFSDFLRFAKRGFLWGAPYFLVHPLHDVISTIICNSAPAKLYRVIPSSAGQNTVRKACGRGGEVVGGEGGGGKDETLEKTV